MRLILIALMSLPIVAGPQEIWAPSAMPPTLRDIASRLPPDSPAVEPDLITYAHEGNHFLCRGRAGWHGIYIGGGRRWEIPTPPLVTEEVFAAIPQHRRNSAASKTLYSTYLKQGQGEYWSRQPLMILDEWRAYTVGSLTRQELGIKARKETVAHTQTFSCYADVLYKLSKELDGYDSREMQEFCRWNLEQCYLIDGFHTEVTFD